MSFQEQKESILNAVVAYRLLNNFVSHQSKDDWAAFEALIDDAPAGEFEILLGMMNLCTVLLWQVAMVTGTPPDEVLSSIGASAALIQEGDLPE